MEPDDSSTTTVEEYEDVRVVVHGVLAPEGVRTRDGRKFGENSVWWNRLPLPLLYQDKTAEGHDASVRVGKIEEIIRKDGLLYWQGSLLDTAVTDEVVQQIAEEVSDGLSVDLFDVVSEIRDADGNVVDEDYAIEEADTAKFETVFTEGELGGATIVAFPAFREAYIALGPLDAEMREVEKVEEDDDEIDALAASAAEDLEAEAAEEFKIDEGPWDGDASNYTPEQWFEATLIHLSEDVENKSDHKLPILTPEGDLSRAGVHAAASRVDQVDAPQEDIDKAKAALRSIYEELDEDPPESIQASGQFVDVAPGKTEDGPGWLTHPIPTDRLRDYWTKGPGAAKIGWGLPGDFNRCRTLLAQYVKPQYLSGYCANRHYDALKTWPGRHSARTETYDSAEPYMLVASGNPTRPPAAWFKDPNLLGPSPLTVTEDGRVFGHVATWETCHIAYSGKCITPPRSQTDYSHFCTGSVLTEEGETVRAGVLTIGTGHADAKLSAQAAAAHYDDTGTAAALVEAGEDQWGIWVAGAVAPWASEEQIAQLRAAPLSGDWRQVRGNLEMVAALGVNVGGFPVPRSRETSQGVLALVAAGVVPRGEFSTDEFESALSKAVQDEMDRRESARMAEEKMASLRSKVARKKLDKIKERRG